MSKSVVMGLGPISACKGPKHVRAGGVVADVEDVVGLPVRFGRRRRRLTPRAAHREENVDCAFALEFVGPPKTKKSAPPQYVRPHECVPIQALVSELGQSLSGNPSTKSFHTRSAVATPICARAIRLDVIRQSFFHPRRVAHVGQRQMQHLVRQHPVFAGIPRASRFFFPPRCRCAVRRA